jgi:hypothetical protein
MLSCCARNSAFYCDDQRLQPEKRAWLGKLRCDIGDGTACNHNQRETFIDTMLRTSALAFFLVER